MSSVRSKWRTAEALIRADAARWITPQHIAPLDEVTWRRTAVLLFHHTPLRAMTWYRLGTFARELGIRGCSEWTRHRLLRVYGLDMSPGSIIGGGLYIAHTVGCVLHAEEVGSNVTVIAGVVFGTRTDGRWPRIGDETFFGAGCCVLGGISVGARSTVGANAVVLADVPCDETVVGVPARRVERR